MREFVAIDVTKLVAVLALVINLGVDARSFQTGHFIMTLTDKAANAENSAWNACAIEKGQRYLYFSEGTYDSRLATYVVAEGSFVKLQQQFKSAMPGIRRGLSPSITRLNCSN